MTLKNNQIIQNSRILSVGAYRPSQVIPNSEIVDLIESSDEWIQQRTGIQSRHRAPADQSLVDMSVEAANIALSRAKIGIEQIDSIIFATISYPFQAPSAATELAARLGANKAAAFDISAACAGFSYAVGMASDLVRNKTARYVLVVGGEKLSDFTDPTDRATAFIFADGVGAVIIGPSESVGIGPTIWGSDVRSVTARRSEPDHSAAARGGPNILSRPAARPAQVASLRVSPLRTGTSTAVTVESLRNAGGPAHPSRPARSPPARPGSDSPGRPRPSPRAPRPARRRNPDPRAPPCR